MKNPYFAFFPGDYLADTIGLSCCEHGVYLLLMAVSWQRGPLPDDMDHLARLAANPPIEALRYILQEYWSLTDCGWINARLERERERLEDLKSRQSAAGKKAITARWGKADTNRIRNVIETNTTHTHTHKKIKDTPPTPSKTRKSTRSARPESVAEVAAYCRERKNKIDPNQFVDYYESRGWKIGKTAIKDWRACVRTWERRDAENGADAGASNPERSIASCRTPHGLSQVLRKLGLGDGPAGADMEQAKAWALRQIKLRESA